MGALSPEEVPCPQGGYAAELPSVGNQPHPGGSLPNTERDTEARPGRQLRRAEEARGKSHARRFQPQHPDL